ncbi:hypothetical protein CVS27_01870 [Arthrobacter glacialis]|uniref:Uncharacterized protein n=1 Tax=Arthrobacter glacialis TaxID=1664 RepID=A0A2S4A1L0_ARTGL|nr:hypothetical protein CVS27_01870 [Arthrobacter glacialis]
MLTTNDVLSYLDPEDTSVIPAFAVRDSASSKLLKVSVHLHAQGDPKVREIRPHRMSPVHLKMAFIGELFVMGFRPISPLNMGKNQISCLVRPLLASETALDPAGIHHLRDHETFSLASEMVGLLALTLPITGYDRYRIAKRAARMTGPEQISYLAQLHAYYLIGPRNE